MSYETTSVVAGLFYNFTFVKMRGPNKSIETENGAIWQESQPQKHVYTFMGGGWAEGWWLNCSSLSGSSSGSACSRWCHAPVTT